MLKIDEFQDLRLQTVFLEMLFEGAKDESEERARLFAIVSQVYGKAGARLATSLEKNGQLRTGVARAMIHGFILRRHEIVDYALAQIMITNPQTQKKEFCPIRLREWIVRILTEEGARNKEATLAAVMPIALLPKGQSLKMVREKREEKKVKPMRMKTTRTQAQIDAALSGSGWEGAIIAANAEVVPPGFVRLSVLEAKGVKRHNLSNPLKALFEGEGIEQIYILKGWYREDLLKACAFKVREPARSGLLDAIEAELLEPIALPEVVEN